jgi:hypothetical protein
LTSSVLTVQDTNQSVCADQTVWKEAWGQRRFNNVFT